MYSILVTETAKKFLKKLPKKDREAISNKLYSIRHKPFPYVKKLQGQKLWRLRIQHFRAVLDIIISENKIIVLRVGHRKDVYDKI